MSPHASQTGLKPSRSIGQLRSGVLRTGKLVKANQPKSLSKRGVLTAVKASSSSSSIKPVVQKNSSTALPLGGHAKKRGNSSNCDERYQAILAKITPERMLRVRRIRPVTLLQYADHVDDFVAWARRNKFGLSTDHKVDIAMSTFFNALFEDALGMNVASYSLFGWICLKMIPKQPERQLLPLSRAVLTAWRGISPGGSKCWGSSSSHLCLRWILHREASSSGGSGCSYPVWPVLSTIWSLVAEGTWHRPTSEKIYAAHGELS